MKKNTLLQDKTPSTLREKKFFQVQKKLERIEKQYKQDVAQLKEEIKELQDQWGKDYASN